MLGSYGDLSRAISPDQRSPDVAYQLNNSHQKRDLHLHVADSPLKVFVNKTYGYVDPAKCKMFGPGLDGGIAGEQTSFMIELVTGNGYPYPLSMDTPPGATCVPGNNAVNFVQVVIDEIVLSGESEKGKVVDNCNGTYTAVFSHQTSGEHTILVRLGPEEENPNFFEGIALGIGDGAERKPLVYSAATAQAEVQWRAKAAEGIGNSGGVIEAIVYPQDAFDNLQDYKNQTDDGLSVTVTVNDLYTKKVALEKKEDNQIGRAHV